MGSEGGRGRAAPGWRGTPACGSYPCSALRRRRTVMRSEGRGHPEKLKDLKCFQKTQEWINLKTL